MKVLLCVSSMGCGGAERNAAIMANAWAARGDQVTLVMTYSRRGQCFYKLHGNIKMIFLADLAPMARIPLLGYFTRILALRRLMRDVRPNVIVSYLTNVNVTVLLASVGVRAPVLVSERSYPPLSKVVWPLRMMRKIIYPLSARVIIQSNKGLDWLKMNIGRARGIVIPNAVQYPSELKERIDIPEVYKKGGRRFILAVGRLVPLKGYVWLVESFSRLSDDNPSWDLIILGEGMERKELEGIIGSLGLGGRVLMPGIAGNVGEWCRNASIFVMSSRFEGFPNALAEAMACGCPAVSYDCDTGPREIIRDGIDGLLVRPVGDVAALAKALGRLMGDDELRKRMADRAPEVIERYSIQKILALWDRVFEEVGARHRIP